MRTLTDAGRIWQLMEALARSTETLGRVYFTGGVSAVLFGWRSTTVDVDLKLMPDSDELLRAIPILKEKLSLNVELASPDQFIPELPGWRERSVFIDQIRRLSFFHYDFYSQALSKLERGHVKDLLDAGEMLRRGLIERGELLRLFSAIEPELYRYPAIDPPSFRTAVEELAATA
jgi:hypothetical protein